MNRPGTIYPGTSVVLSIVFTDDAGVVQNPLFVIFKTFSPCGTETKYTYGIDPEITRPSTGNYQADILPDEGGRWRVRWEASGVTNMATEDDFIVKVSPFVDQHYRHDYQ